jgi:hypothetical protein
MNQNAFLYYQSYSDKIKELCLPLSKYLGISHFGYTRVYNDSNFLYLSNNLELAKEYLLNLNHNKLFFKSYIDTDEREKKNTHYILWPDEPDGLPMDLYIKYDYWNGLTIHTLHDEYIEGCWFVGSKENSDMQIFFVKNLALLKSFIIYFNNQISQFIKYDSQNLAYFKYGFDFKLPDYKADQVDIQSFMNHIYSKGLEVKAKEGIVKLTGSEIKCLKWYRQLNFMS